MKLRAISLAADFRFPVLPISAIGKLKKIGIIRIILSAFLFICFQNNINALEATHYFNEICGITGIYDSKEYGIIYSNSTGLYKLDKETGVKKLIPSKDSLSLTEMETFFSYNNEIYFYKEYGDLFKMEGDVAVRVADLFVMAHYVSNNKIYLINSKEPRIVTIEGEEINNFVLGDSIGMHLYAEFAEVQGEVYAYVGLNWSGYRFIVKINDTGLEYLMSPKSSNHKEFHYLFPSNIYSIKDELWIETNFGIYKLNNSELEKVDTAYEFTTTASHVISCIGDSVFGINEKGAYVADLPTKNTRYLVDKQLDYTHDLRIYEGKELIYYLIDDSIYTYNITNHNFLHVEYNTAGKIMRYLEGIEQELIIAKFSRIELYKDGNQKFYEDNTVATNEFFDVCYDRANERIVVLGRMYDQFVLQFYDGIRWDTLHVPFILEPSGNSSLNYINIEADFNGNYFVGIEDFMGVWDGTDWNIISVTKDIGDTTEYSKDECYHVLLLDSLGNVWVSAYRGIIDSTTGEERGINQIIKFSGTGYDFIAKNAIYDWVDYFINGICLKNGDIYLNSWSEEMYRYINRQGRLFIPEDGDDHPYQKTSRVLCENSKGQLVVFYNDVDAWSYIYGALDLPGSISIFDGNSWDHDYYTEIAGYYSIPLNFIFLINDPYGNDLIICQDHYVCISPDGSHVKGPINNLDIYFDTQILIHGNKLWFSNIKKGLFKIDLPYISDVDDKQYNNEPYSLLANTVISGNYLELNSEIVEYKIYSLNGRLEASGIYKKYIDISNLGNGLHYIVYNNNSNMQSEKFLINR